MQSLRDWLPFSLLNVQTSAPLWGTTHKGYCRPSLPDEKGQIVVALDIHLRYDSDSGVGASKSP